MINKKLMIFLILFLIFIIIGIYAFGSFLPINDNYTISNEDKFLSIDGYKIRYKFVNRNAPKTIVFLHSFGGKLEMWDSLSKYFDKQNILTYDLIGFGKSDKPDINYSLDVQSDYLLKILNKLEIDSCILIGSSMGASTTAWTASKYPERIKALVLFAPSGYPGSMNHSFPGNLFYKPGILNTLGKTITATSVFKFLFPNSLGQQTFTVTATYDNNYVDAIKKIKQPTLLIWSSGDRRSLFSYAGNYLNDIQNSRLIEKPVEAGHNCPGYKPQITAEEIKSFLSLY